MAGRKKEPLFPRSGVLSLSSSTGKTSSSRGWVDFLLICLTYEIRYISSLRHPSWESYGITSERTFLSNLFSFPFAASPWSLWRFCLSPLLGVCPETSDFTGLVSNPDACVSVFDSQSWEFPFFGNSFPPLAGGEITLRRSCARLEKERENRQNEASTDRDEDRN